MADDIDDWEAAPITLNTKSLNGYGDEVDDEHAEEEFKTSNNTKSTTTTTTKSNKKSATTTAPAKPLTAAERNAEALRLKKLVEEADARLAGNLFGNNLNKTGEGGGGGGGNGGDDSKQIIDALSILPQFLSTVRLESVSDGETLANAMGEKLKTCTLNNRVLSDTIKIMLRQATANLGDEDVTDIINSLTIIKGEKLKAKQKTKMPGMKKPKPKLNESSDKGDVDIDMDIGRISSKGKSVALDEDDFM
jgi:hypothetical protein